MAAPVRTNAGSSAGSEVTVPSAATYNTKGTRTVNKTRKRRKNDEATASTGSTEAAEGGQVLRSPRTSSHVAGRRGKLKFMTEMPIDTLHEIFGQLNPVDLLNLSWASKRLRSLIMEKPARYIWQVAFERLYASDNPPPRCPEDIAITKYTRFLFNKKCMMCGTGNGYWTSWTMRLRVCSDCIDDRFTRRTLAPEYSDKLPFIIGRYGIYFLKRDVEDAEQDGRTVDRLKSRFHDAESFRIWERQCLNYREKELDSIRLERKKAVFQKLEEIGWKQSDIEEIADGKVPANLPGLKKAKKLTNKDWQEIKPRILQYLGNLQERHECTLKRKRSENRWLSFTTVFTAWRISTSETLPRSFIPHPADIAVLEPFRSAIFLSDTETVDFDVDTIDRAAKEWMRRRDTFVFSLFPRDIQDRYSVEDFQHSLHSLLILRFSGPRPPFTGAVDQVCGIRLSTLVVPHDLQDLNDREARKCLIEHRSVGPWMWTHSQSLSFDIKAYEIGKDVITFLGLDPYTTTFDHLVQCQRRFTCSGKHLVKSTSKALNGVEMLEHDRNLHEEQWTPAADRWKGA